MRYFSALLSIQVLTAREAVRRRPGMYIGDVRDGSGLHHMLWEVVSNSLDEHRAGRARRVRISVEGQLAEVEDDGGGLPVAKPPSARVRSFVGQRETEEGGTHVSGFWKGLVAALAAQPACRGRLPRRAFRARRRLAGLHAIVHVEMRHPRFGGPTRSYLASREVEAIVRARVEEAYGAHLHEHPGLARRRLDHATQ